MSNRLLRTGGSSYMGSPGQDSSSTLVVRDVFMYFGLASFATTCSLYLSYLPKLHDLSQVPTGQIEAYASMEADMVAVLKGLLVIEIFFWLHCRR
jgi:hypothetical protein